MICICRFIVYRFCVSLGTYCYGFSPGFNFDFLSPSQLEIGWEERLRSLVSTGTLNLDLISVHVYKITRCAHP